MLEYVNEKSDATLVKRFHDKFQEVLRHSQTMGLTVYLLDMLEQLHFIEEELVRQTNQPNEKDRYKRLRVLL